MMINFMCQSVWTLVPRYLVKHFFWMFLGRCFLDEVNICVSGLGVNQIALHSVGGPHPNK